MIRPLTLLCFLLACGSGLYLYQTKHRVQMLDREIERTVHAAEALRDQTRLLGAEWMLLNDPERLRALADQFLTLRSVTPGQFTTMADLDKRLPAVRSPDAPLEPVPEPAVMTPMVPPPVADKDSPAPPAAAEPAAPQPAAPAAPRPSPALIADRKPPAEKPAPEKPRVATVQAVPKPPAEARGAVIASAAPRATPHFSAPVMPIIGGSALGMAAHASSLPPPVPIAAAGPRVISLFPVSDH